MKVVNTPKLQLNKQKVYNLNNELKKNNNPNNPNILIINDTTLNRLQFSLRILFP